MLPSTAASALVVLQQRNERTRQRRLLPWAQGDATKRLGERPRSALREQMEDGLRGVISASQVGRGGGVSNGGVTLR